MFDLDLKVKLKILKGFHDRLVTYRETQAHKYEREKESDYSNYDRYERYKHRVRVVDLLLPIIWAILKHHGMLSKPPKRTIIE